MTGDGRYVVVLDQRHHLWLYEAQTGRLLADSQVGPVRVDAAESDRRLAVSPNGRIVAVATTPLVGPPIRLLDAPTLRALPSLGGLPARGWMAADLAYSGTGRYLAALLRRVQPQRTVDGSPVVGWGGVQMQATAAVALVWDLTSPQRPIRVPLKDPNTESLALDHGGEVLYTSGPLSRHDLVKVVPRCFPSMHLTSSSVPTDRRSRVSAIRCPASRRRLGSTGEAARWIGVDRPLPLLERRQQGRRHHLCRPCREGVECRVGPVRRDEQMST